jgi:hypothetical protein
MACNCKIERTEVVRTTSGGGSEKVTTIKHDVNTSCPEHGGEKLAAIMPKIEWPDWSKWWDSMNPFKR